jgi:methylglutaconyl-CoA hydratase
MSDELVLLDVSGDVATVTMNRPDKRNALSVELINALHNAVGDVRKAIDAGDARVMVLAGAGKSFCAGMDLRGVIDDAAKMAGMLQRLAEVGMQIRQLPVPTIALVQGAAVGGGCGLMVVPDFAVTHPQAKVGYPEVTLGICPAVVAPWLIKKIGAGRARHLLLEGGTISGTSAHEIGLATHLCSIETLDQTVSELAASLLKGGAHAMSVTKRWLNELDGSNQSDVFDKAWKLSADVIAGDEAQQRLRTLYAD